MHTVIVSVALGNVRMCLHCAGWVKTRCLKRDVRVCTFVTIRTRLCHVCVLCVYVTCVHIRVHIYIYLFIYVSNVCMYVCTYLE